MINLLPPENKSQIRAARTNVALFNYLIILGAAFGFLALVCGAIYLVLFSTKASNEKISSEATTYNLVRSQSDKITNSLSTARSIIDQRISFSSIITGIAAALPADVIINSLSLSSASFDTPITLQLYAKTTDKESQLQSSFSSSLFSNPKIISNSSDSNGPVGYPWKIIMTVNINRGMTK